jgi:integrase
LNTSVFIIPKFFDEAKRHGVKNREDRLVVLNSLAREVIEGQRGIHPEYVFLNSRGRPVRRMCREAWRAARKKAKLLHVRVHDLKHTYGRRLRAAGVSFEDRQDLLGHKSARITTHYSAPELLNLIQASERICQDSRHKSDTLVILRKKRAELRLVNSA